MQNGVNPPATEDVAPARTANARGQGPYVIVVDHASNRIPSAWGNLGLPASDRIRHIAWDPGALAVSMRLSEALDAPVVSSTVSRLVIDCNRRHDAPDLIPASSEDTEIAGNQGITDTDRDQRIAAAHTPFHGAIEALLDRREAAGLQTILVCMHSFTPIYRGKWRPWPIGLIHGRHLGFTAALRDALADSVPGLNVGWNEPYAALNGVTYTLEHHGDGRGLHATMIEIRHNEILQSDGVALWASRLVGALEAARVALPLAPSLASSPHRGGNRLQGRN